MNEIEYALQVVFPSNKKLHIVFDNDNAYLFYRKMWKCVIWKLKIVNHIGYADVPKEIKRTVWSGKIEMHKNRVYIPMSDGVGEYIIENKSVISYSY